MKKKVVSISLICVFALSALMCIILPIVYFIRGNFMQNLSEYMVDLDSATAFGISDSVDTARANSVNASSNAKSHAISDKKHHKNYMVVQKNGSDEVHKVVFKKRHDKDHKNDHDSNISQDDMSAEIDKLYVLGDYTFISFVREGESKRPDDNKLEFDTDGIAFYDKKDYYTDNDRKSYIIDNTTGYIYAIVDFNISKIQGGCLLSKDDNYIYDFKITSNDELEIFSLFTNDTIEWFSCFKDKYGNKYIQNNVLNTYDSNTHTYYYTFIVDYENPNNSYITYELTSTNEAIKLEYGVDRRDLLSAKIITENNIERNIVATDNFDILYKDSMFSKTDIYAIYYYRVKDGKIYGHSNCPNKIYTSTFFIHIEDCVNNTDIEVGHYNISYYNFDYLEDYDMVFEFSNNKLCYYTNISETVSALEESYCNSSSTIRTLNNISNTFIPVVVLDNCSLSSYEDYSAFLTYGINGNTHYEVVVENVNGQVQVNSYVSGTYEQPQTKILLQPINK